MSTDIDVGRILSLHKGTYSGAATYSFLDEVIYEGSTYRCINVNDSTGNLPTNATYWQLVASKGDKGDTGDQGPVGPAGADGENGVDGVDGADAVGSGCSVFTSSGTFTCPTGITHINVLLIGGGGGGLGANGYVKGSNGGDSSFGAILTAGGGRAGDISVAVVAGSVSASDSILILKDQFIAGSPGGKGTSGSVHGKNATGYGNSGGSAYFTNAIDGVGVNTAGAQYQASGGGCLFAISVPVTDGNSYTITIGAGGIGGNSANDGGNGAPGICIVEW